MIRREKDKLEAGINHFVFISAVLLGLGIYLAAASRNLFRILTGVLFIFSASLLNIAAFSGLGGFNPEGQLLLFGAAILLILILATGALLAVKYYRLHGSIELFKKETE